MSSQFVRIFLVLALALPLAALAQKPSTPQLYIPAHAKQPSPPVDDAFVQKQFGTSCKLLSGPAQFVADLDSDGVDDLVVVARCTNPMADQGEYNFAVIDPYNANVGFGDPRVTSQFATEAPERRGIAVLVIHGVGPDAWRAEEPKAKFLIINLPLKDVAVKRLVLKKQTLEAIYVEETGEGDGQVAVIFWDGKKYRYQSMGGTME